MKIRVTTLVALATWGTALAGEQADFAVPVIGYVYDAATRGVRPMAGTPGAATVRAGSALVDAETALVPGDGSFAIVASSKTDTLQVVRSNGDVASLSDVPALFDKGQLSAGGNSALLYTAACNCVYVVAGLRESPSLQRRLVLPEGSEVRSLSVSDSASVAAVAVRVNDGSKVLLFTDGSEASAELGLWADFIALDASGERLLVVETPLRKAHIVSSLGTSPTLDEILTEKDGLISPAAAAFGANGGVFVADADAGIFIWNPVDRTTQRVACACKPGVFERTGTADVFRLSNLEQGAVWLFDASPEPPRTFFVPAPRAEAAQ